VLSAGRVGGQWQRLALARGLMRQAPLLVVLDGGRVAETGDHTALLGRPGIYAELFIPQAEGYLGRCPRAAGSAPL
jgi:ABC-type multidrug transport system fused ATPase/permease subunit